MNMGDQLVLSTSGTLGHVSRGRVILWTLPRAVSTPVAQCIAGIPGTEIWFEPYAISQIAATDLKAKEDVDLPAEYEGNEAVYARASGHLHTLFQIKFPPERLSYYNIQRALQRSTSKYVFVKDDTIAMRSESSKQYLPAGFKHAFIIRHPDLVFASLHKARFAQMRASGFLPKDVDDENKFDLRKHSTGLTPPNLFYKSTIDLWRYIREQVDPETIVIDASDLLSKPAEVLSKFCEAVGLPYSESLLEWDSSMESAKKWMWPSDELLYNTNYLDMSSSRFLPPKQPLPRDQLTEDVITLSDETMPLYEEMHQNRLKI